MIGALAALALASESPSNEGYSAVIPSIPTDQGDAAQKAAVAKPSGDLLILDQVIFDAPGDPSSLNILKPDHSMHDVVAHLKGLGIRFSRRAVSISTGRLPADLATEIRRLPKGEPFLVPADGRLTVSVLLEVVPAAEAGDAD